MKAARLGISYDFTIRKHQKIQIKDVLMDVDCVVYVSKKFGYKFASLSGFYEGK